MNDLQFLVAYIAASVAAILFFVEIVRLTIALERIADAVGGEEED